MEVIIPVKIIFLDFITGDGDEQEGITQDFFSSLFTGLVNAEPFPTCNLSSLRQLTQLG